MNKSLQFPIVLILGLFTFFTACEKDSINITEDVEFFVNSAVFDLEERGNCGQLGCYTFVFPISIQFADSSIVEVADYDNLRTAIRDWKAANPDAQGRPEFAFPLEVMDESGNIISVTSATELEALRAECGRDGFRDHRGKRGQHQGGICFEPVFPLSINLPDSTVITLDDPQALKDAIRSWDRNHHHGGSAEERPSFVFPIQVQYEDGSVVDVADPEALKALREACAG